jgi:hypothetical protein
MKDGARTPVAPHKWHRDGRPCSICGTEILPVDLDGNGATTDDDGNLYCEEHNTDNPTSDFYRGL